MDHARSQNRSAGAIMKLPPGVMLIAGDRLGSGTADAWGRLKAKSNSLNGARSERRPRNRGHWPGRLEHMCRRRESRQGMGDGGQIATDDLGRCEDSWADGGAGELKLLACILGRVQDMRLGERGIGIAVPVLIILADEARKGYRTKSSTIRGENAACDWWILLLPAAQYGRVELVTGP